MRLPTPLLCLLALAAASRPAAAQDNNMGMPDGSRDLSGSVMAVSTPRSEGSRRRQFAVLPSASARWSNGLFADMGQLGWNIADGDPNFSYGPIATLELVQRRSDDRSDKTTIALQGGAFATYGFARGIAFSGETLYGGGPDHHGLRAIAAVNLTPFYGPHSAITLSPGLVWANASYMRSAFGIDAAQSARSGLPMYEVHAGLKDVVLSGRWDWQITNKLSTSTILSLDHLVGTAAGSPLIERRDGASLVFAFNWHF